MELELVGGTIEDTGVGPNQSFIDDSGNFINTYQPPRQSGFATFLNDFFTPQRINAIGGLFTKKPSNFNTPEDFGTERNNTGIVIVSLVLVFLVVLTIFIVRRKRK